MNSQTVEALVVAEANAMWLKVGRDTSLKMSVAVLGAVAAYVGLIHAIDSYFIIDDPAVPNPLPQIAPIVTCMFINISLLLFGVDLYTWRRFVLASILLGTILVATDLTNASAIGPAISTAASNSTKLSRAVVKVQGFSFFFSTSVILLPGSMLSLDVASCAVVSISQVLLVAYSIYLTAPTSEHDISSAWSSFVTVTSFAFISFFVVKNNDAKMRGLHLLRIETRQFEEDYEAEMRAERELQEHVLGSMRDAAATVSRRLSEPSSVGDDELMAVRERLRQAQQALHGPG